MTMSDARKLKHFNAESNIYIRYDIENNGNIFFENGIKRSMNLVFNKKKVWQIICKETQKKKCEKLP